MISVVVPIYNVEKYVVSCLQSIISQEYRDFELLLVNDGSKDRSMDVVKELLADKDVEYRIIDKPNGGQASARNAGLKAAAGEYVVFIDADDVIAKDFLAKLVSSFNDDADFTFCGFRYVNRQEPFEDQDRDIKVFDREQLLTAFLKRTISFVVPSMLFRRSFLLDNELWFAEMVRFSEDQSFIWDVILHTDKAIYLPKRMYSYYLRENSIMTGSPYNRILSSYQEFRNEISRMFAAYPEYEKTEKMIVPRWVLGTLYSSAHLLEYPEYKKLYEEMDGRKIFRRISGIGEIKAYLLGFVSSLSPKLLYVLCRRMDLNG